MKEFASVYSFGGRVHNGRRGTAVRPERKLAVELSFKLPKPFLVMGFLQQGPKVSEPPQIMLPSKDQVVKHTNP